MPKQSVQQVRQVAQTRVHDEREMKRLKDFTFLKREIPMEYKDIIHDIVWVSVCIGNYDVPLTSKDWEDLGCNAVDDATSSDLASAVVVGETSDEMALDDGMQLISDIASKATPVDDCLRRSKRLRK